MPTPGTKSFSTLAHALSRLASDSYQLGLAGGKIARGLKFEEKIFYKTSFNF
jgi:hypothetical protein